MGNRDPSPQKVDDRRHSPSPMEGSGQRLTEPILSKIMEKRKAKDYELALFIFPMVIIAAVVLGLSLYQWMVVITK